MDLLQEVTALMQEAKEIPKLRATIKNLEKQLEDLQLYGDWYDLSELSGRYEVTPNGLWRHINDGKCPLLGAVNKGEVAYARVKPGTNHKYQMRECYVRMHFSERQQSKAA